MKDIICFAVFAFVLAGCCGCFDSKPDVVIVERTVCSVLPPPAPPYRTEEILAEETVSARPCCHTLLGDALKASVLIVTDVVGLVVPIEDSRKTTLRRRTFEGW